MSATINHEIENLVTSLLDTERQVLRQWLIRHNAKASENRLVSHRKSDGLSTVYFLLPKDAPEATLQEMKDTYPTLFIEYEITGCGIQLKPGQIKQLSL